MAKYCGRCEKKIGFFDSFKEINSKLYCDECANIEEKNSKRRKLREETKTKERKTEEKIDALIEKNKKLYDDKLLKLLKRNKGDIFSVPQIRKEIGWEGRNNDAIQYSDISESQHTKWLRKYLKNQVKEGVILEYKKGNAFNYYVDEKARLENEAIEKKLKIHYQEMKRSEKEQERNRINKLKSSIIKLLKEKDVKMPASDIDAFLKHQNVDEIKELCEKMYHNGEISRTSNYRYFILTEEKKKPKPKKASPSKPEAVDVKAELKKYKEMLDEGLITQEQYDAKSNELLGL